MSTKAHSIGDIVEAYCSRCRLNLDTSVAAVLDGHVQKIMCRTCGNECKYRPPVDMDARKQQQLKRLMRKHEKRREEQAKPTPVEPSTGESPRAVLRKLWDELTDAVDARYARVYDPAREYEPEEAILHKRLGMGIVQEVNDSGTMRVLFRTGFEELEMAAPEDEAG